MTSRHHPSIKSISQSSPKLPHRPSRKYLINVREKPKTWNESRIRDAQRRDLFEHGKVHTPSSTSSNSFPPGDESPPAVQDDSPVLMSRPTSSARKVPLVHTSGSTFQPIISYPDYFAPEYYLSYRRVSPSSAYRGGRIGYTLYLMQRQVKWLVSKVTPVMRFSALWMSLCMSILLMAFIPLLYLLLAEGGSGGLVHLVGGATAMSTMERAVREMKTLHLEAAMGGNGFAGAIASRTNHDSLHLRQQQFTTSTTTTDLFQTYRTSLSQKLDTEITPQRFSAPIYAGLLSTHLSRQSENHHQLIRLLQFLNEVSLSSLIGIHVLYHDGSFLNTTGALSAAQSLFYTYHSATRRSDHLSRLLRGTLPSDLYKDFQNDILASREYTSWSAINNQLINAAEADNHTYNTPSSTSHLQYSTNATILLSKAHVFLDYTTQNMRSGNSLLILINCVQIVALLLIVCITIPISFAPVFCCSQCIVYPIKKRTEISEDIISKFVPKGFLRLIGVQSIVELRLGTARREELSVMFADIRDFQFIASGMSPRELFEFLNKYLRYIGPEIRKHNGYTDKYLGSGLLALFPHCAADAVRAAIQMHRKIKALNRDYSDKKSSSSNKESRKISIGVGIHTGTCIVGVIGEKARVDASIIGDSVNLASRIHGLTKRYAAHTLITKDTLDQCPGKEFTVRYLGNVVPKGKSVAIGTYEVLDPKLNRKKIMTRTLFEKGMTLMLDCNFNVAKKHFEQILQMDPADKCSAIRKDQCDEFKERDVVWDGTLVVNEK